MKNKTRQTNITNTSPNLSDRFPFLAYQTEPRQAKDATDATMIKAIYSVLVYAVYQKINWTYRITIDEEIVNGNKEERGTTYSARSPSFLSILLSFFMIIKKTQPSAWEQVRQSPALCFGTFWYCSGHPSISLSIYYLLVVLSALYIMMQWKTNRDNK